jgi:hypothetical protein
MNKYEKLTVLDNPELFRLLTGVTKEVFALMYNTLQKEYDKIHKIKGGNPNGTPIGLKLVIALEYWREYRGLRQMAFDYNMPLTTLRDCIVWVEDVLSKSEQFKIPELKEKYKHTESENSVTSVVIVDVEEQPIERPQENQKAHYSGKKNAYGKISNNN